MRFVFVELLLFCFVSSLGWADEISVTGKLKSVGMFKNGLAVIEEEIAIPSPGRYMMTHVATPIHGTFFVESPALVETTVSHREVELPLAEIDTIRYQTDLVGQKVRITLKSGKEVGEDTCEAEIIALGTDLKDSGNQSPRSVRSFHISSYEAPPVPVEQDQIVFKKATGQIVVTRLSAIQSIEIPDGNKFKTIRRDRPVMIFEVAPSDKTHEVKFPTVIRIRSLQRGISWVPSYKIRLGKDQHATVEQTAILVNQWRDMEKVSCSLISGFPQVEFKNVNSPLAAQQTLEQFFRDLSQYRSNDSSVMTQQAVMMNSVSSVHDINTPSDDDSADEIDTFYKAIGEKTLRKGDKTFLSVATGTSDWKQIICWNILDLRDEWGKTVPENEYGSRYGHVSSGNMAERNGKLLYKEPWDVVELKNPFSFPMTTAPATLFNDEKFLGQSISYWVSPGEKTTIPINKALSIRVESKVRELNGYYANQTGTSQSSPQTKAIVPPQQTPNQSASQLPQIPQMSQQQNNLLMEAIEASTDIFATSDKSATPIPMPGVIKEKMTRDSSGNYRVVVTGSHYRIAVFEGTATVVNHRKDPIDMKICRRLFGEPIEQESETATQHEIIAVPNSGVNRCHEFTWLFKLQPGEKKTIVCRYQVLIAM